MVKMSKQIPEIRFKDFTDEWEQRKLGEVSKRVTRKNKDLKSTRPLTISAQDGLVDQQEYFKKQIASRDVSNYYLVKNGEFAYNKSYSNGYPWGAIKRLDYYPDGVLSTLYIVFSPTGIDSNFLVSYYDTTYWHREVSKHAAEGARNHGLLNIAASDFFETELKIPNLQEEQIKIGNFFKQLDETITLHQDAIQRQQDLKKAMLQKLFPVNGSTIPTVRFASFTEEWEQRKLGELMDVTSVKRIHQSDWTNHGVRFLRARDIVASSKNEVPSDYLYISEEKYKEYTNISGKVKPGDLLVTGVGSIGVPMLVVDDTPVYFKDGNIIWFKNENKIDGNFFYYSFTNTSIQKFIRDVAGIGTVGTYTIQSGKKTPILLPNFEEQQKIGAFFKFLDDTIALHQQALEKLKLLKKSLLQKMFVN